MEADAGSAVSRPEPPTTGSTTGAESISDLPGICFVPTVIGNNAPADALFYTIADPVGSAKLPSSNKNPTFKKRLRTNSYEFSAAATPASRFPLENQEAIQASHARAIAVHHASGVPDFPGHHNLNCDTGFQPVLVTFDFHLARFGSNKTSSTGRRPVSQ
jgi:hypothetical protein